MAMKWLRCLAAKMGEKEAELLKRSYISPLRLKFCAAYDKYRFTAL